MKRVLQKQKWAEEIVVNPFELTKEILDELFANKVSSVRIRGFATENECKSFVHQVKQTGFDFYKDVYPPIGRIGITQFEFDKEEYFSRSESARATLEKISKSAVFNPLQRLLGLLRQSRKGSKVDIAYESSENKDYFAGLVRQINVALLHVDFAQLDAKDWSISDIESQIAWNLYLQVPDFGGECVVFNREWDSEDQKYKLENSYGYDEVLVKDTEQHKIKPFLGDLVFHNTRNYHKVLSASGERLTLSSFIGKLNDSLILWS